MALAQLTGENKPQQNGAEQKEEAQAEAVTTEEAKSEE